VNIHMYASAQSIAAALLGNQTVTVPAQWLGGYRYRERNYTLADVKTRFNESPISDAIVSTMLKDQAEGAHLMVIELRKQAAELAAELFAEHCKKSA